MLEREVENLWTRVSPLVDAVDLSAPWPDVVIQADAIARSNGDSIEAREIDTKLSILRAQGKITRSECLALMGQV